VNASASDYLFLRRLGQRIEPSDARSALVVRLPHYTDPDASIYCRFSGFAMCEWRLVLWFDIAAIIRARSSCRITPTLSSRVWVVSSVQWGRCPIWPAASNGWD